MSLLIRIRGTDRAWHSRLFHAEGRLAQLGADVFAGLLLAAALPAQTSWMRAPLLEGRCGAAYDVARQRVVLFGGESGYQPVGNTWEWDGVSWALRNPAARPSPRTAHAMAYDLARQRVVG